MFSHVCDLRAQHVGPYYISGLELGVASQAPGSMASYNARPIRVVQHVIGGGATGLVLSAERGLAVKTAADTLPLTILTVFRIGAEAIAMAQNQLE